MYDGLNLQRKYEDILYEILNKVPYAEKGDSFTYIKLPYKKIFSTDELAYDVANKFLPENERTLGPENKLKYLSNEENVEKLINLEIKKIEKEQENLKLLDKKISDELNFYIDSIKKNGIDYVIKNAREIADRQEIKQEILDFPRRFSEKETKKLLNEPAILNYVYSYIKEQRDSGRLINFGECVYDKVDCYFEDRLLDRTYRLGKNQIENSTFSEPSAENDFNKLLELGEVKNNSTIYNNMVSYFKMGQRDAIKQKIDNMILSIPKEDYNRNKDYIESLRYDNSKDEFDNFYNLGEKKHLIEHLPEIDKVNSKVKVFVFWSESNRFKENQAMSIDDFKNKYEQALEDLKEERINLGFQGGYDKTSYMFLFDDGNKIVNSTNPLRADIGDFENFESYLTNGFNNKNIYEAIKNFDENYSEFLEDSNDEEEM